MTRYAIARPVDPWAQRQLARLALETGHEQEAIAALRELDRQETRSGAWAYQLAQLQRQDSHFDAAADAIDRALRREPYNATYRELAATIALQRHQPEGALSELQALATLEPKRVIHLVRLAALHHKLGQDEKAHNAAIKAKALDPNAPVDQFLK